MYVNCNNTILLLLVLTQLTQEHEIIRSESMKQSFNRIPSVVERPKDPMNEKE
jgi:hypothetical protein